MKPFRFSVASLMAFVLLLALGLVALRAQTLAWASAVFTVAVALFSASIVGALATRGLARSTWTGMAVFGWAYLIIAFGPWVANGSGPPPLLTSSLLDGVQDYIVSDGKTPYIYTIQITHPGQMAQGFRGTVAPGAAPPPGGYKNVDLAVYMQAGHSLFSILFGILGALVGRFIAARSQGPGTT